MPFHQVLLRFLGILAIAVATGLVASGLALPWVGITGVAAHSGADAVDKFPENLNIGQLSQTTRILDSQGKLITTLYDQNRVYKPLSQISPIMVRALLATEDARFYQHGAMDLKGTLRALITDQAGSSVQGGSSITQQLVKQTLLYNAKTDAQRKEATEETVQRKVRELRYAIALEEQHSKSWILERYLNTAYFGDSAYGVQAAAKHYFGVDAKSLTWPQAALLAGMVKNPTGYDPTDNPDAAIARRATVFDR
ncbi:MAG: transglycosylase domain-containing protein, partial [Nocardioides sp.]|nr:transglycosylase domain-containing protein [Nocardioides sp.]